MAPKIGPLTRFETLARQVQGERAFYDRKARKHISFGEEKGIYLNRGFTFALSGKARRKKAEEIVARRGRAAEQIYRTIAEDLGPEAAEAVFLKVKGRDFARAGNAQPGPKEERGVTLEEFDRIAREVETIRQGMSGAILNGVPQQSGSTMEFNAELSACLNASFAGKPAAAAATPTPAAPEVVFSPQMLRELGAATYVVDGEVVSSPDPDETGYPTYKDKDWEATVSAILITKLWNLPQVREADYGPLSNVLHSGLFTVFQGLVESDAEQKGAGLVFHPLNDPKGLAVRCTPDVFNPGTYRFSATLKAPLTGISDAGGGPGRHDALDPARSSLRMEIHGVIDCNDPAHPIAVEDSAIEYAGHLASAPPRARR